MLTGPLRSKIDRVWDAFWSGGISNPMEVIEQITYLIFIRRLDELQTLKENKANRLGEPIESPIFKAGQQHLRWSRFKNDDPAVMFQTLVEGVFPFLRTLGADDSTYATHMRDARFTIPTPALLAKVVDLLDDLPLDRRDTNGDLYEYMLGKLSTSGQNGQFRTPRHIIGLMVAMMHPKPDDEICDPACGTAGFLVAASEHLRAEHPTVLTDATQRFNFHHRAFTGYDFDSTMLRIGSMNMLMHGVESPDISYRDSLSGAGDADAEKFSLILANPPFAGSLDYEAVSKQLQQDVKTKKTELLFLARFLRLLKPGGRAAVIVPDGVLFGSSNAHKSLRRRLVEDQKLDAVVKLPAGAFKPYAGVSTAILLFKRTDSGGTDDVWFYDIRADGWSLDDKRTPLLDESLLGCRREVEVPGGVRFEALELTEEQHEKNNLPDVLRRWLSLSKPAAEGEGESARARTEQSFLVPKADIVAAGYDLSLNRYREIEHEDADPSDPLEIIAELEALEAEIQRGLAELRAMLS